ncbi:MAG: ATP-binding cassette domain-containing protein [Candidatus Bruticola sp.]
MGVPILEVNNLARWGRNRALVVPVSFVLEAGDIGVVISQNLSSSSHLLRTAVGLYPSTKGSISLCSYPISSQSAKYLLGFVSADPELYEDLTVWEQLYLFADIYNVDIHYRPYAIYEALETVRITDYKDVQISTISDRSLLKRISLARALVHSPRLLVVENLFQGSDFRNWQLAADILNEIRNTGKAILLSADSLQYLHNLYSQLFLVGEDKLFLQGSYPQILQEICLYSLVQLQVWDTGIDSALICLSENELVLDLLQKEGDPGVMRFFFKGNEIELEALVCSLENRGAPIVSCSVLNNFFGR